MIKVRPTWEKFAKPKTYAHVLSFRKSFIRSLIGFALCFVTIVCIAVIDTYVIRVPKSVGVVMIVIASFGQLYALFLWLGGKACCPNCGKAPIASSGLAFGISPFIKRCSRCDYPLTIQELEKDLAAEANARQPSTAMTRKQTITRLGP